MIVRRKYGPNTVPMVVHVQVHTHTGTHEQVKKLPFFHFFPVKNGNTCVPLKSRIRNRQCQISRQEKKIQRKGF